MSTMDFGWWCINVVSSIMTKVPLWDGGMLRMGEAMQVRILLFAVNLPKTALKKKKSKKEKDA